MSGDSTNDPRNAQEPTEGWIGRIDPGELDHRMHMAYIEQTPERVVAEMPVEGNRQGHGILHGGASIALAESAGSWAAVLHAAQFGKIAVGTEVNATHHSSATEGTVRAVATPIKLGRTMTSHEVVITHIETGRRLCTVRISNFLKDAPEGFFD
ncbi:MULTISPECIES: hotdog fold thioesterase [Micrococcales]|uniref:hotdog fold thioesterase n=1 Tax=Micrococcales TaxID=85006 RepID=UPI0004ABD00E|nr:MULTISPECIES: hotdog fold thioesterase [Micrococcales]